ncbi:MAG: 3-phosphoshikimate 1-carboxyvinyltransferase [Spirochaetales bacterium]|nr:3-phosphoshikimate 1-carboxyvinyltransferase [Spirochaetales bacterium]
MNVTIQRGALRGTMAVPGSKSDTIRAVLLSMLSEGRSVIHNPLASGDGLSAKEAAIALGASITEAGDRWIVEGVGRHLEAPQKSLDLGNSGTATSFFSSIASLARRPVTLTGDEQIQRRPFKTLFDALEDLGVEVSVHNPNKVSPPVTITGPLLGGTVTLQGFNSQFVSSLLLVSPFAEIPVTITVHNGLEKPYVQLTLDWMKRFGIEVENPSNYEYFEVPNTKTYRGREVTVSGDWSAAAFPLVASVLTPSDLTITGLDFSDSQGDKRVVDILKAMGADIAVHPLEGTLSIRGGKPLIALQEIDLADIPDALPSLVVAATQAHGTTTFTNISHVRVKETDRVFEMTERLNRLGCSLEIGEDELHVHGPTPIRGGTVSSAGDHRIAMAMVAAALAAREEITITETECVAVSFPDFFERFEECGMKVVHHDGT